MNDNIETTFTGAEDPVAVFWEALHDLGVFSDSTVCAHDMMYSTDGEMRGTLLVSFGPDFNRKVDKEKVGELVDALNDVLESRYMEELAIETEGFNDEEDGGDEDGDDEQCVCCAGCAKEDEIDDPLEEEIKRVITDMTGLGEKKFSKKQIDDALKKAQTRKNIEDQYKVITEALNKLESIVDKINNGEKPE